MGARAAALRVLAGSEQGVALSDELLDDATAAQGLKPVDRALVKELVAGVLRHRGKLDWVLDGSLKRGIGSLTAWERNNLRIGLYQIAYLDRIPQFAAVDECVKLAKRYGRRGTIGLTNAVLRDIIRKRGWTKPLDIADSYKRLSIEHSHPEWLVKRWIDQLGMRQATELLGANNRQAPLTIRANRLKTTRDDLFHILSESEFDPRRNAFTDAALDIGNPQGLVASESFRKGFFYIQDAAAQATSSLIKLEHGAAMLDLCASPGGKLSAAAETAAQNCLLVGVDLGLKKLDRVRQNLRRLGIGPVQLACADAANFASSRQFDLVLADVPCSGLGVLRRRLDLRWRISEQDIARLAALQARIIDNAALLVKPGGRLIYSTCTLTPEENEGQVDRFLGTHDGFRLATPDLPETMVQDSCLYLWPQRHGTDGAFAACLKKMT